MKEELQIMYNDILNGAARAGLKYYELSNYTQNVLKILLVNLHNINIINDNNFNKVILEFYNKMDDPKFKESQKLYKNAGLSFMNIINEEIIQQITLDLEDLKADLRTEVLI